MVHSARLDCPRIQEQTRATRQTTYTDGEGNRAKPYQLVAVEKYKCGKERQHWQHADTKVNERYEGGEFQLRLDVAGGACTKYQLKNAISAPVID